MKFDTLLLHQGAEKACFAGSVTSPIFQSATYRHQDGLEYHDNRYSRLSNTPNHDLLHARIAALEMAEAALVTASGMAAISAVMFALLAPGDEVLVQSVVYGGTHNLLRDDLLPWGVKVRWIDPDQPKTWDSLLTNRTRMIYVESLSNPSLTMPDLEAVVAFAKKNQLISVIDNTFPSPVNFQPLRMGFDLSLHSATKYLNGHSDITAGAVAGTMKLVHQVLLKLNHLGGSLDPHACFLLERGMKTLSLRIRKQNENALGLARFLADQPRISQVIYPGLETHPQHSRVKDLFARFGANTKTEVGFGGMLAFEMREEPKQIDARLRRLKFATLAPSLGGVETLVIRPTASSHQGISEEELKRLGLSPRMVRVSVGIEDLEDLKADFSAVLS